MKSNRITLFKANDMTVSLKLAEEAINLFNSELPVTILNSAKQAIIDQYGLQIAGSEFSWSKSVYKVETIYNNGHGSSSVTRYGDKVSPIQAAFINSCFAHAQDFDDSHQEAQTHPGSVIIPAAIAIGEQLGLNGKTILKAIAIGMEVMLRLAHSLCPACIEGGHHTPPTIGPFGSTIACGLLLNLNSTQLANALGICGSYSGGLVEYTVSGGSVKRIHTGLGARAGLEAALLAQEGLTGPTSIIEGPKGMWSIYGRGKAFPERLFDQLGQKYLLQTIMFKPYNCCYLIHPAIEAFLDICSKNTLAEEDIASVAVGLSKFSVSHVGKISIPTDELGAQFSTSFTLALSLVSAPPGMWSYTKDSLTNKKILSLAQKISVYLDAEADSEFPKKNGCIVTIQTTKKTQFSRRIKDPKGSPLNLLTVDDVKSKFLLNTIPILGKEKSEEVYKTLISFDQLSNIDRLSDCISSNTIRSPILGKL